MAKSKVSGIADILAAQAKERFSANTGHVTEDVTEDVPDEVTGQATGYVTEQAAPLHRLTLKEPTADRSISPKIVT